MEQKNSNTENLVEDNLRLVHSLCRRFVGKGIEYEDLYQIGCTGLVKAAKGFDKTRGIMFSTYAVPVILGEIKRIFRDGGDIKVSRGLKELNMKIMRVKNNLELNLNREATISEIAEELSVSPEEVTEALCACQSTLSLTKTSGDEETEELDVATENEEDRLNEKITIDMAIEKLDIAEQNLIKCRYYKSLTQTETAKVLSISQVQVSRNEKRILKKLKTIIELGA